MPSNAIFRPVRIALFLAGFVILSGTGCTPSEDADAPSHGLPPAVVSADAASTETPPADMPADGAAEQPLQDAVESVDAPADDTADQPLETSAQLADVSDRYMSDSSSMQAVPPENPPGVETAVAPDAVPSDTVAEAESRQEPQVGDADPGLKPNPLRRSVSANTDAVQPDSAAASETTSDHGDQGHGSSHAPEEEEPFDPIAANGPIFEGWPKPKLALVISGRQDGYLEPCGCAGLDRMKGGLSRRHSLIRELREKRGWEVLAMDVGGLVKGFGRQAELKFHLTENAFRQMEYQAIGLGTSDLKNRATEILSVVAGKESPFHSANVGVFGFDAGFTNSFKIVEAGGMKFGITSVLGKVWQQQVKNPDIELADPEAKLAEVLPKLAACDKRILLAHATTDESDALWKKFPQFDIVVTADGASEPPAHVAQVDDDTILVEVGTKGMNVIVLGLYDDPEKPYRDQRVPLDSRFPDSAHMRDLMIQYQAQLQADGFTGLGIRKQPHYQLETHGRFVGSKECKSCHEGSYKAWKNSGHAKAFETLVEARVPRQFDPECISCHVIGWHPNKYFPYESGYWSAEETPHLRDVGCENCHGPGEKHIDAENHGDIATQEQMYELIRVTKEQAQESSAHWCINCHDIDNSPDFNFEQYWPKIEHHDDD